MKINKIAVVTGIIATLTTGALIADTRTGGCPTQPSENTYCCAYPNGVIAATGKSTPSANACCIQSGDSGLTGGFKGVNIGGKISYYKVIVYNSGNYPLTMSKRLKVLTSPCSAIQ